MSVNIPETVDLSKYIDTQFFGVRPHIRGRRVLVALLVGFMKANQWTIADTVYNLTVSEPEVYAALLYYEEHKEEIDQQEVEELRLYNEMKEQYGKR